MKRWIIIGLLIGSGLYLFFLFSGTNVDLHEARAELNFTKTDLDSTKTELESTKIERDSTKIELESTKVTLGSKETELNSTKEELHSTQTELTSTLDKFNTTQSELESKREELTERETELADLQISYEGLMTGHGYTIKDPTYNEMMRFLRADDTDKADYIKDEYECVEFSTDLCNGAEEEGIRCAYVNIRFPDGKGHAIVAFNTMDKGLIYVEPQFDDLVRVEIGKSFHKCIVTKAGYYYEKPDYDDTIEEVLIAW